MIQKYQIRDMTFWCRLEMNLQKSIYGCTAKRSVGCISCNLCHSSCKGNLTKWKIHMGEEIVYEQ